MKRLKDYTDWQKFTDMSDIEIITAFFIDNDMEEEAMEITHKLAKSKIEKMRHRHHIIKEWAYAIPSEYLYENYPLNIASRLHRIELDYIVNGKVSDSRLEWAKQNVPNIKMPECYFMPCMDWLEKQGIKFKNSDERCSGMEDLL